MANRDPFKPKPLVDARLVTEFGGIEDMASFKADGPSHQDYTYVPGASDKRYDRDVALSALHRGEIRPKDVPVLAHNLRWVRAVQGKDSAPDQMKTTHAKNQGYVAVTKADVGKPFMTALPPGAQVMPDGTIRSSGGDVQLFVADQQTAARNAMRKKLATDQQIEALNLSRDLGEAAGAFTDLTIGGHSK